MVRNTTGGNKAKKLGNRNMTSNRRIQYSSDPLEMYGIVTGMPGGRICSVYGTDGKDYICHIRGAFCGKNKGSNFIKKGLWVLFGKREWSETNNHSDLLCIYSDKEQEQVLQQPIDFSGLQKKENELKEITVSKEEQDIQFQQSDDEIDFEDI